MIKTATLPVKSIVVPARHRKDLGESDDGPAGMKALVESIRKIGLLHPPVVNPGGELRVGERRLEAVKRLGWTTVPVTVAATLDELKLALDAELLTLA